MLFDYLWDNKPAKIKRSTIIAPVEQGGLGMIDVFEIHTAAKCGQIRRLYDDSNAKWKSTFLKLLNIGKNKLNKNLDIKIVNKCRSDFHKQTLTAWIKVYCQEPKNYVEIVHQFHTYNKLLTINKKTLMPSLFKSNNIDDTYNIRILDNSPKRYS